LQGCIAASERAEHWSIDGPKVGVPSILAKLHIAGPERGSVANLHCFCEVILMDEPESVSADHDLDFFTHPCAAALTPWEDLSCLADLVSQFVCCSRHRAGVVLISRIILRIPQPLFCARSLLIVKFGLLFDGLGFPESRLDALGQVLAGGTADAGDVDVDLAVFADDELYLLHKISTSSG
jgi:hypothetical protein